LDGPGELITEEKSSEKFRSPKIRRRRTRKRWISRDLRFVPDSPQSEKPEREGRSRSRHKGKRTNFMFKKPIDRFVSSEKSDNKSSRSVVN